MSPRYRTSLVIFVLAAFVLLNGCAVNRATSSVDPSTDLSSLQTFHVKKYAEDTRGTDAVIAQKLRDFGFAIKHSVGDVDALVTYEDRWFWDITFYMLELTVTLRDPASNFPLATGNSYHTSLSRKSQEDMVDEVLTNIFYGAQKEATSDAK